MRKILLAVCSLLVLASCKSLPAWFGDSDEEEKLPGQRVSVLRLERQLHPDTTLAQMPVQIPPMVEVDMLTESDGALHQLPEHIAFSEQPKVQQSLSVVKSVKNTPLEAVPLYAEGRIYLLGANGTLSVRQAENIKKVLFERSLVQTRKKKKKLAGGGMAYDAGKLFANVGDNQIVALSAEDGKELWRRTLVNVLRAAPVVSEGRLYVLTIMNQLYALDKNTGSTLWMHSGAEEHVGVFGAAAPSVVGPIVVVPHSSGELYAIRAQDGHEGWSANLVYNRNTASGFALTDIDATPVIRDNRVFATSNAGPLFAIDARSGAKLWEQDIEGIRQLWTAGNMLYAINNHNELLALHTEDGRIKWVKALPVYEDEAKKRSPIMAAGPILAGNRLWVVLSHGKLLGLSPADGEIGVTLEVPENITLPPVVVKQTMYLLSDEGKLTVVR